LRSEASVRARAWVSPKCNRRRSKRGQLFRPASKQRSAFHKVESAEPGRKRSRTRSGKNVVRPRHIIANGLRSISADKYGARVADSGNKRRGVGGDNLKMFRREVVDQADRIGKLRNNDNCAEVRP